MDNVMQSDAVLALEVFLRDFYPTIALALMAVALLIYLARYVYEGYSGMWLFNQHRFEPAEELRFFKWGKRWQRALIWAVVMYLLSRAAWFCALQWYVPRIGYSPLDATNYNYYINKWDTVNYTRIAQYWYGFEDHGIPGYIKEYTIAFLPGFPIMIRGLNLLVGDYVISGLILSNAFCLGSGLLLYLLVADMYSEPAARRACFFFNFSTAACVFSATHSESAFLFLTLLAVYLARKRRFIAAVAVGAYAAFTRQFGMLVAVPVFYEMLRHMARYPSGADVILQEDGLPGSFTLRRRIANSVRLRRVWRYVLLAACILIGYAAYLFVNWQVYGDPFKFLYYQQLNWGNRLTSIDVCVRTNVEYLFNYLRTNPDKDSLRGIFLPQTVMAVALPALLLMFWRRGDAGDNAYAFCYITITYSSTWLISGIRYIAAMYPLYIMLALLCGRRGWRWVLYPVAIALFLFYNVSYCVYATIV